MPRVLLLELVRDGALMVQTPATGSTGAENLAFRTTVHLDGDIIVSVQSDSAGDQAVFAAHTAAVRETARRLKREAGLVVATAKAGGYGVVVVRWCAAAWAGLGGLVPLAVQETASLELAHFSHVYYALAFAALSETARICGRRQIQSWLQRQGYG